MSYRTDYKAHRGYNSQFPGEVKSRKAGATKPKQPKKGNARTKVVRGDFETSHNGVRRKVNTEKEYTDFWSSTVSELGRQGRATRLRKNGFYHIG